MVQVPSRAAMARPLLSRGGMSTAAAAVFGNADLRALVLRARHDAIVEDLLGELRRTRDWVMASHATLRRADSYLSLESVGAGQGTAGRAATKRIQRALDSVFQQLDALRARWIRPRTLRGRMSTAAAAVFDNADLRALVLRARRDVMARERALWLAGAPMDGSPADAVESGDFSLDEVCRYLRVRRCWRCPPPSQSHERVLTCHWHAKLLDTGPRAPELKKLARALVEVNKGSNAFGRSFMRDVEERNAAERQ